MKLNWNFPEGGEGVQKQKTYAGSMDISGTTHWLKIHKYTVLCACSKYQVWPEVSVLGAEQKVHGLWRGE